MIASSVAFLYNAGRRTAKEKTRTPEQVNKVQMVNRLIAADHIADDANMYTHSRLNPLLVLLRGRAYRKAAS